jgi:RNA polymerase sigma factor (TIGR02999 family)
MASHGDRRAGRLAAYLLRRNPVGNRLIVSAPEMILLPEALASGPTEMNASVTDLLNSWHNGEEAARDRLVPLVYDELRRLARAQFAGERRDHTLQPTALVHEAYLRLMSFRALDWQDRNHFFALAATSMRRILVSHARKHCAAKRGLGGVALTLREEHAVAAARPVDLIALDTALAELERLEPRQCRVVELRYFGGLTIEETADALEISPATVKLDWSLARAWLFRELSGG